MSAIGNNNLRLQLLKIIHLLFFLVFYFYLSGALYFEKDTAQINSLTKEAYGNARKNPDQSISTGRKALSLSKTKKYTKGIADASLALGAAFLAKYNPDDSATYYHHKALDIYKQINDVPGQGRTCYGLSYLYNFKGESEKAWNYGELSVKHFEQVGKSKETIAALGAVIYLARRAGNYDEALELSKKAVETARIGNDTLQWANALNDQGQVYKDMFLFNQAIDSYFEAFKLWELKKDSSGLAIAYGSIANTHFYQEDYRKSLEYNFKKLPITQKLGDMWETNKTINNIALAYSDLNQNDSALIYARKSLKIAQKRNYPVGVANSCDIMSNAFLKMNKPDSSYSYSKKAVDIAERNKSQALASYLINLASALEKQKNYQAALSKAKEAHDLAKNRNDAHTQRAASFLLSEIYHRINQREMAYQYLTKYLRLNDSITNKEYMRKVTRLDIQHEYDKKQRAAEYEIEILDKNNQLKTEKLRKTWITLIALLLLSLAGATISFLVIRNKNHRIDQMNLELRNYLFQLEQLKTEEKNEDPVLSLIENYGLTQREAEIMELIATGIGNEEIAKKLFVSKNTIKFHIKNIFIKLDVRNRVQALQKMAG